MAQNKTKPNFGNVQDFLEGIEDPVKRSDCLTMAEMMKEITGEEPVMWGDSIIGFDRYPYKNSKGEVNYWPAIGFSPRKQNLTLYIMPGFERYQELLAKLGKHSTGKSCLYIKRLEDVDPQALRQLVEASVQHMKKTYG